jgi:hypothetical protein
MTPGPRIAYPGGANNQGASVSGRRRCFVTRKSAITRLATAPSPTELEKAQWKAPAPANWWNWGRWDQQACQEALTADPKRKVSRMRTKKVPAAEATGEKCEPIKYLARPVTGTRRNGWASLPVAAKLDLLAVPTFIVQDRQNCASSAPRTSAQPGTQQ